MTINQTSTARTLVSAIQRRKLAELYRAQTGCSEIDALRALDVIFMETFKHPVEQASYEEAARITARFLAEQRNPQVQQVAPAIESKPPAVTPIEIKAESPSVPISDFPESPYSWNLHAEASDGWDEQFTIRASDSETFIKKIEGIKHYLSSKGYKPAQRGGRAQANAVTNIEAVPNCAVHKVPMVKRSKDGRSWWSCTEKLDDGQWCQYRPKQG